MLWVARWVPRLVRIRATHVGVLFGRSGRVTELQPGLWWYWPIVSEREGGLHRAVDHHVRPARGRPADRCRDPRVLEPAGMLKQYRKIEGRLENEARTRVLQHGGDMAAALADVRATFAGHLEIASLSTAPECPETVQGLRLPRGVGIGIMTEPMTAFERVAAAKAGDKRWCTACGEDRVDRRSRCVDVRRLHAGKHSADERRPIPLLLRRTSNEVAEVPRSALEARHAARKTSAAKKHASLRCCQECVGVGGGRIRTGASQAVSEPAARLTEQHATGTRSHAARRKRYREDSQYREGPAARIRAGSSVSANAEVGHRCPPRRPSTGARTSNWRIE